MLWGRDLIGALRHVLLPLPSTPVGVGATWAREWDDYVGGAKITERREYKLLEIDPQAATARIRMTASSSAFVAGSGTESSVEGTITVPLGARAVPTLDLAGRGNGTIRDASGLLQLTTTSKISVRPQAN